VQTSAIKWLDACLAGECCEFRRAKKVADELEERKMRRSVAAAVAARRVSDRFCRPLPLAEFVGVTYALTRARDFYRLRFAARRRESDAEKRLAGGGIRLRERGNR